METAILDEVPGLGFELQKETEDGQKFYQVLLLHANTLIRRCGIVGSAEPPRVWFMVRREFEPVQERAMQAVQDRKDHGYTVSIPASETIIPQELISRLWKKDEEAATTAIRIWNKGAL